MAEAAPEREPLSQSRHRSAQRARAGTDAGGGGLDPRQRARGRRGARKRGRKALEGEPARARRLPGGRRERRGARRGRSVYRRGPEPPLESGSARSPASRRVPRAQRRAGAKGALRGDRQGFRRGARRDRASRSPHHVRRGEAVRGLRRHSEEPPLRPALSRARDPGPRREPGGDARGLRCAAGPRRRRLRGRPASRPRGGGESSGGGVGGDARASDDGSASAPGSKARGPGFAARPREFPAFWR